MRDIAKICLGICTVLFLTGCRGDSTDAVLLLAQEQSSQCEALDLYQTPVRSDTKEDGILLVYVCGQVNAPGVYELAAGSRICDALEAAGGLTEAACPDYWNLAQPLMDGQMIAFPTEEEAAASRGQSWQGADTDQGRDTAAGAEPGSDTAGQGADGRVNINTAPLELLMTLPGIGQAKGAAIIAYRDAHGAFVRVEDIMQVSGVGNAVFEKVRDHITVD